MTEGRRKGVLLTILGALLGAGYLITFKFATRLAPAEILVLPMLLCAAALNTGMSGLGIGQSKKGSGTWRVELLVALLLGAFSALGNEAMAQALALVSPGIAAVFLRTQVLFVALGGWWLLAERVSVRFWIGTGVAMGGFVLLKWIPGGQTSISVAGALWALIAALAFASMQVLVRRTIHRINPVRVNGLRLWFAVLIMACIPGRISALTQAGGMLWGLMAATALLGPVLSRIFLMLGLRTLTAALSTLVLFTGPLFAFLLAGAVFGTWPGLAESLASMVILAGVSLPVLEWVRAKKEVAPSV
jgi:drug/metabolite transporter (DMT)-like permease